MAAFTVYLDQVFLGNMVMNYAILWAAAKLSRAPVRKGRLAAGAALGAGYALVTLFPGCGLFLTLGCKTIASVIITAVTFSPVPLRLFFTCLGCFYLTSLGLGGLALGVIFFLHAGAITSLNEVGMIINGHLWTGILLGLAALGAAVKGLAALQRKGLWEKLFKIPVLIRSGCNQVKIDAFLDTGNQLTDPLTGRPVIVVEYSLLKPLLPLQVRPFFEAEGEADIWEVLSSLGGDSDASRFSAIPFQSLGKSRGLILGYRPDEILLEQPGRQPRAVTAILAIYRNSLVPDGSYQALLGPDLLNLAP
jgi:stage II sporulation protein GA (sporulation sigma-E factor processing peptidase)